MTARDALYYALMTGGIPGTGHTPDRSTRATQLMEAFRNQTRSEAATEQRTTLLSDGYDLSCRCDTCTPCLIRYAITAIDPDTDYYEDVPL
jgi:hypothetical protein